MTAPKEVASTWRRGSQLIREGDELHVRDLGRCRFRQHVVLANGSEYVDVVHPTRGFFSVWPKRVMRVPRKTKLRPKAA